MSLGQWVSAMLTKSSQSQTITEPEVEFIPSSCPSTLTDWLHKKKDEFKPEIRVQTFVSKAEQCVDSENYEDAIAHYSKAIELLPTSESFYTNRSYCHELLQNYDLSLIDAQKAIDLSEESVVRRQKASQSERTEDLHKYRNKLMFYRKARALRHMNRFQEAIDALVVSKSLAIECPFIDNEIKDIKLQVICDLGYEQQSVEDVCNQLDSIDGLIKLLNQSKQLMITDSSVDQMPSNPFKYRGLYVNGLAPDLEENRLNELLSTCGELIRCKVYSNSEQSRSIIAFTKDHSVREAIRVIRSNPDIIRDKSIDNLVFRYRHTCAEGTDLRSDPQIHFKGTEIGGECFKWRTTGCDNKECKALHIPLCHQLDYQSVETKSERKRQPIVFDSNSTPEQNKTVRKIIKFDVNGDNSSKSSLSLISPSKRLKPIIECIDISKESQSQESVPTNSDRKVIRFNSKINSQTNGLNLTTDSEPMTPKTHRKRIVFDLTDDEDNNNAKDSTTDKPLIVKKYKSLDTFPLEVTPTSSSKDRCVTSYDDLFD